MAVPDEVWRGHQQARFPIACLSQSAGGMSLVKLDAGVGAILTASLRTDGRVRPLPEPKRRELERYRELILEVLRDLPLDPEGRTYFERLAELSRAVIQG